MSYRVDVSLQAIELRFSTRGSILGSFAVVGNFLLPFRLRIGLIGILRRMTVSSFPRERNIVLQDTG